LFSQPYLSQLPRIPIPRTSGPTASGGTTDAQRTRILDEKPGGERRYVTRTRYTEKPREEWIAVPVPDAGVPKEDVERARDALRHNEKCSSAGRRFWELSGGIFRCAECGRALVAVVTTLKGPKGRRKRMFYYMCATRRQRDKHACSFSKSMNAQKAEAAVWDAVTAVLTDPETLRPDLETMIEREKEARGDPEREARAWAATLAEAERKREKYQEMYAADAMKLEELRSRLETLEETRESARRELAELASWPKRLQALERDKELLLESYAARAPEALDSLGPEERRTVYSMLGLRVDALLDKSLRIRGGWRGELSLSPRQNVNKMMQQMQQQMQQAQEELANETVTASAGGGAVRATMTGSMELVSIEIDPEVVDPEDVEMLQDMVLAAVNEAMTSSQELANKKLGGITGGLGDLGLNLPGL
jgi:nucleoid-associated protein EbfC